MKKVYEKPVVVKKGNLARITAGTAISGSGFDPNSPSDTGSSDRRLKTNISRMGTTVFDLPLYRFSYLGSDEMFTGVMAQDVLDVMPEAVVTDAAGFHSVKYGMLGIQMQKAA